MPLRRLRGLDRQESHHADLSIDFCGVKAPNPFWLASAPPTNSEYQVRRAFDAGWGGAVWKTLGDRADRQRLVALRRRSTTTAER